MGIEIAEFKEVIGIIEKYSPGALVKTGPERYYQCYIALRDDLTWADPKAYKHPNEDYDHDGHPAFSDEDNLRLIELDWWWESNVGCWTSFY